MENMFFVAIVAIVLFFVLCQIIDIIKPRLATRRFLKNAEMLKESFCMYFQDPSSKDEDINKELIKSIHILICRTIKIYEKNALNEYNVAELVDTYDQLNQMSIELRRWLWVNGDGDEQ